MSNYFTDLWWYFDRHWTWICSLISSKTNKQRYRAWYLRRFFNKMSTECSVRFLCEGFIERCTSLFCALWIFIHSNAHCVNWLDVFLLNHVNNVFGMWWVNEKCRQQYQVTKHNMGMYIKESWNDNDKVSVWAQTAIAVRMTITSSPLSYWYVW